MYTQIYKLSCGPSSIILAMQQLGCKHIPLESKIAKTCRSTTYTGTHPRRLKKAVEKHLDLHTCKLVTHTNIQELKNHINQGGIAIVLYMADRKQNPHNAGHQLGDDIYGMHYSVCQQSDKDDSVRLLNPFGYEEMIKWGELKDRMSFEKRFLDAKEKFLVRSGLIKPYTALYIS